MSEITDSIAERTYEGAHADGPRLLADIGATNAHFALERVPGRFDSIEVLKCSDYAGIEAVVRAYLRGHDTPLPKHAAIAIANPIDDDWVSMTNRDWQFSIEATRRALGLESLLVVNDFTALAQSLARLSVRDRRQLGGGAPHPQGVVGVIGPGTGLGVSGLIPVENEGWITLGSEGGHASFAPADEREMFVLQYAWREFSHVSTERLVSGSGLEIIYRALAERHGAATATPPRDVAQVIALALDGSDALCAEAVECFCAMLGTVASDVAVTLGAVGGIYIGGGIVPHLGELFHRSGFRQRFEAKGRFSRYVADIPTYVITADNAAFHGVSAILAHHLKKQRQSTESPLVAKVRAAAPHLSKAEQRVAHYLLAQTRSFLNEPVAEIARCAGVSQPTVIRFCRTLGFSGLADFKLKATAGLSGTIPVRHSQVKLSDSAPDLSAKVLDNTVSGIMALRDALDASALERAIALLHGASRIELYGAGNSSIVAQDGQYKFFRLRIPAVAYAEPRLELMAAGFLGPGDVVVAVSSSGVLPELLAAVDVARANHAEVIAITASHSPLARKATVTLAVDHSEDSATQISMISRILHLLMIDVLAVGVAVRQADARNRAQAGQQTPRDDDPVGRLISHAN